MTGNKTLSIIDLPAASQGAAGTTQIYHPHELAYMRVNLCDNVKRACADISPYKVIDALRARRADRLLIRLSGACDYLHVHHISGDSDAAQIERMDNRLHDILSSSSFYRVMKRQGYGLKVTMCDIGEATSALDVFGILVVAGKENAERLEAALTSPEYMFYPADYKKPCPTLGILHGPESVNFDQVAYVLPRPFRNLFRSKPVAVAARPTK